MEKMSPAIRRLIGVAIVLVLWEIGGQIAGESFFAPPSAVIPAFLGMLGDGKTVPTFLFSFQQMIVGFGLAYVIGVPLGIGMGRSKMIDQFVHPWASMFVVLSAAALVPLFIVLLGTGFTFRAGIVFMASIWYVVLTVYHGARGISPRYLDVAKSFGADGAMTFRQILLPALFPYLVTAARLGIVHALRAMVVAELYVVFGFGQLIQQAGFEVSTAPLLALLLILMIASLGLNRALGWAGNRLAPWYAKAKS